MNRNERSAAYDLDLFLTAIQAGEAVNRPVSIDGADVDMLAALLTFTQAMKPDPAFVAQLRVRLEHESLLRQQPTRTTILQSVRGWTSKVSRLHWRSALASAVIVLLLVGSITLIPPARIWALSSIDAWLSHFGINRTMPVLPVAATPALAPTSSTLLNGSGQPDTELSRETAQAKATFRIKAPTYLPAHYRAGAGFEFHPQAQWVFWRAWRVDGPREGCAASIRFSQSPASKEIGQLSPIGTAAATPVAVGEAAGIWIENRAASPCTIVMPGKPVRTIPQTDNLLIWEQGGIRYELLADSSVGLSEMLKVAESLR